MSFERIETPWSTRRFRFSSSRILSGPSTPSKFVRSSASSVTLSEAVTFAARTSFVMSAFSPK